MKQNQSVKADAGKPRLELIIPESVIAQGHIRTYGVQKYGAEESWKEVAPERYRDAALRHLMAYLKDPLGVDEESGYPHLWHAECNLAFLIALEWEWGKR